MRKLNNKKSISLNQRGPTVSRYVYESKPNNDSTIKKVDNNSSEGTSLLKRTELLEKGRYV